MYVLPVKSTDRVLEIGSGHNPHPRSDVLCDRFLYDNQERQRFALRYDRPLVIAKGEQLPFADKSFDFVLCSQILEHTEDPQLFVKEVSRVGKAGLIIVPSSIRERMFGWHYHHWYFYIRDETLVYAPKENTPPGPFAHFMHVLFKHSASLRRHLNNNDRTINVYYYWKDECLIRKNRRPVEQVVLEADGGVQKILSEVVYDLWQSVIYRLREYYERINSKIKSHGQHLNWNLHLKNNPNHNLQQLISLIRCPVTFSKLEKKGSTLISEEGGYEYPLDQGIPILLTKKELEKGY